MPVEGEAKGVGRQQTTENTGDRFRKVPNHGQPTFVAQVMLFRFVVGSRVIEQGGVGSVHQGLSRAQEQFRAEEGGETTREGIEQIAEEEEHTAPEEAAFTSPDIR